MRRVKDETKLKQKRCQGDGPDYIPWIMVNEQSSTGSSYIARNYKTGRDVHLLSNAEAKVYFILLWSDEVTDIREQYVLDLEECKEIADSLGYTKPKFHMSTDFLVDVIDPMYDNIAISVKGNPSQIHDKRVKEKLEIERIYWERRGVYYQVIYGDNIDTTMVKNIRTITRINKIEDIEDDIMALKFLLTHKKIEVGLEGEIDYRALLIEHFRKVDELYEMLRDDERKNWRGHKENKLPNIF